MDTKDLIAKAKSLPAGEEADIYVSRKDYTNAGFRCRTDDLIRLATRLEEAETALAEMPKAVPTNWLDSLLTGPDKAIKDFSQPYDCREIEALLRGVQDRLRDIARNYFNEAGDK